MSQYYLKDSVAVIVANSPPVNALSYALRKHIYSCLESAKVDARVKSVVLAAEGKTFPCGADISEFATGQQTNHPKITDICSLLEVYNKPVVMALYGTVFGGGCELAVSGHYRVAQKRTKFAYPEVTLGILPAATGTQKFPRLCGLEAALKYMPTGKQFGTKEAAAMGLVDLVVHESVTEEAIKFARSVCMRPVDGRRAHCMVVKDAHRATELSDVALRLAKKRTPNMIAPLLNIKSVLASLLPYEEGLKVEQQLAMELFTSGQSQALSYAFFAERTAVKWQLPSGASHKNHQGAPVATGAVIGAGTMGTGIAMAMLNARIPVTLVEQNQKFLDRGVAALKTLYDGSVKRRLLTEQQAAMILSQLTPTTNIADVKDADIVIEAVYENLDLKQTVFRQLDSFCKPEAILASNTSYIRIEKIAAVTKRPEKVIGTHFFVPAYYMRLLENVYHDRVSPQTVASAMAFGKQIGKLPVLVGTCDGFVGNRMYSRYGTEAIFLLEEGCLPSQIDRVMEDFGFPMGVLKVQDLSGLDIGWRSRQDRAKALGRSLEKLRFVNGVRTTYLSDILCEAGRFGRKTGKGWYKYAEAGAKAPMDDPWVEKAIETYSVKEGLERRRISDQEVLDRCLYSMINEGFKILEEGIAARPEIVDVVWLMGYGFPRYRGGPMFYASQVGLPRVYERVCHYYKQHPCCEHWVPSRLLARLAHYDVPMQGWMEHLESNTSTSRL